LGGGGDILHWVLSDEFFAFYFAIHKGFIKAPTAVSITLRKYKIPVIKE
jgi:hypothetical protein